MPVCYKVDRRKSGNPMSLNNPDWDWCKVTGSMLLKQVNYDGTVGKVYGKEEYMKTPEKPTAVCMPAAYANDGYTPPTPMYIHDVGPAYNADVKPAYTAILPFGKIAKPGPQGIVCSPFFYSVQAPPTHWIDDHVVVNLMDRFTANGDAVMGAVY